MSKQQPWFQNKSFLITGGSSGIGLAISKELLQKGAKVIIISHNPKEFDDARKACEQVPNSSGRFTFYKCDITNLDDITALKGQLESEHDDIVGLINNAGITTYGPFLKTPTSQINRLMQINFVGTILVTHEIFPLVLLKELGKNDIRYLIYTSSIAGSVSFPYVGGYPGTKAGVEMFLRAFEFELPKNVKILVMRPGPVRTAIYDNAKTAPGADVQHLVNVFEKTSFIIPEDVASVLVDNICKKKRGLIYPSFSARLMFSLMSMPLFGKYVIRYLSQGLRKKFKEV